MSAMTVARPAAEEYSPYYGTYISKVPDGDLLDLLEQQVIGTGALLGKVPTALEQFRYAPEKWSITEIVGHLADSERIFAYRALRFGRNDATALAGFDENTYVPEGHFTARSLSSVVAEFQAVRAASVALFRGFDEAAWGRRGAANGKEITPRALAWIIAGHERHHVGVLKDRYGVGG